MFWHVQNLNKLESVCKLVDSESGVLYPPSSSLTARVLNRVMIMSKLLTDRKKSILKATVSSHIEYGEPVGSKYLVENGKFDLSSATIRNELSELEEMGYLEQVHTSSGRIPTDKGYRLYVDGLMDSGVVRDSGAQGVDQVLADLTQNITDVLSRVSRLMSGLIDYTTIVVTPSIVQESLKVAHLILVDLDTILVVLMNSAGVNSEFLMRFEGALSQDDLNKISSLLTEKLQGKPLSDLDSETVSSLVQELPYYRQVLEILCGQIEQLSVQHSQRQLLSDGISNMIKLPEFKNIELAQRVISLLEEDKLFVNVLTQFLQGETSSKVLIGRENDYDKLHDFSMVFSPYKQHGNSKGLVGMIGPKRMRYSRVLPLVENVSDMVSEYLSRSSRKGG